MGDEQLFPLSVKYRDGTEQTRMSRTEDPKVGDTIQIRVMIGLGGIGVFEDFIVTKIDRSSFRTVYSLDSPVTPR